MYYLFFRKKSWHTHKCTHDMHAYMNIKDKCEIYMFACTPKTYYVHIFVPMNVTRGVHKCTHKKHTWYAHVCIICSIIIWFTNVCIYGEMHDLHIYIHGRWYTYTSACTGRSTWCKLMFVCTCMCTFVCI